MLDIPTCSEEKLHAYISNIELRVDAWAAAVSINDSRSPTDGSPSRDLIASVNINKIDDPLTLVRDNEGDVVLQLVWEVRIVLARPRIRALHQTITLLPLATVQGSEDKTETADLLEPFTALEFNVLEPLNDLPGLREYPYLPASRLEKYTSPTTKREDKIRLKHTPSSPIPAYAVVMPRLRYTKVNTSMPHPSTLASLDIDMIPVFETNGLIEAVDVSMANGKAILMMPDSLPMPWKSKDCLTFLYELRPASSQAEVAVTDPSTPSTGTNANIDTLSITILVKAKCSDDKSTIIKMSWNANVDFSLALNPSFGAPSQPLQRTNRPSSLNFTPYADPSKASKLPHKITTSLTSTRTASTNLQHQVIPTSIPRSESSPIVVSFVADTAPIQVNIPFFWKVLIVNHSSRSVKLAVVPLPRIQRPTNATQQYTKRHAPKASNASLPPNHRLLSHCSKGHSRNALSTAKAVVDEQVVYGLHHQTASAAPNETELVSLTAEIRVGPLGAGQCHETEIQFVAYKTGNFSIDAIRIVDLAKEAEGGVGMINDIRELPDIFVMDDGENNV